MNKEELITKRQEVEAEFFDLVQKAKTLETEQNKLKGKFELLTEQIEQLEATEQAVKEAKTKKKEQ